MIYNQTASNCACGLAWEHTGRHANSTKKDCAYCEPDRWARQLNEPGSTVPMCDKHYLEQPQIGDRHDAHYAQYDCILKYPHSGDCQIEKVVPFTCDQKELSIKQCPKCLTMKSFEGESCARCNVKGESASIEEAKDLAWLLVGGITFGDSRDTPEWRKTILDSAERIILEYFQRVGTIKGDRLIEMAKEESRLEERNRIIDLIKKLIKEQNKHTDGPIIYPNHSTEKCKKCGFDEGIKYCLEYVCTELKK